MRDLFEALLPRDAMVNVYQCSDCPLCYTDGDAIDYRCNDPGGSWALDDPAKAPPSECPLRKQPMLVALGDL